MSTEIEQTVLKIEAILKRMNCSSVIVYTGKTIKKLSQDLNKIIGESDITSSKLIVSVEDKDIVNLNTIAVMINVKITQRFKFENRTYFEWSDY